MSRILGIETSCDETAAAVVEDRTRVRSNVVASSAALHRKYGGVVPELASRHQVEAIGPVVREALEAAGTGLDAIDAVAVTFGPGLVGSLLVGVSAAKAIAWQRGLPLVAVNHLEGHVRSCFLEHEVAYHKAVLDAVTTTLLPALKNQEVKDLVNKVAPAFQAHMLAAQNLLEKETKAAKQ